MKNADAKIIIDVVTKAFLPIIKTMQGKVDTLEKRVVKAERALKRAKEAQ